MLRTSFNFEDIPDPRDPGEAHKIILAAHSTIETLKKEFEDFKEKIEQEYRNKIENIESEIEQIKEQENKNNIKYKKEIEEKRIENENLEKYINKQNVEIEEIKMDYKTLQATINQ